MAERIRRARTPFRAETRHPAAVRLLTVAEVGELQPLRWRLVLEGDELGPFDRDGRSGPEARSSGFDDVVILCFPDPATGDPGLPRVAATGGLGAPPGVTVRAREYTVRAWDAAARRMTIDLVRHDEGEAETWLRRARPGDRLGVIAPRVSRGLPAADELLAIGDATALPALERLLEELPRHARGAVVLAAPRRGLGIAAAAPEGVRVRHVDLADPSARALIPHLEPLLPAPDRGFAWLAGESALVTDLRRWLVAERGMAKERVQFTGYWRRGVAAGH